MPRWFLAIAFLSSGVAAQELPFTQFTPNDQVSPLPSASVQKIVQDHLGYIWMGFYSTGLSRYDGHAMQNYGDEDGLADLTVREIVEDMSHRLWVGSEAGLVVSNRPIDDSRARFRPVIPSRIRRNCLAADRKGWMWVGTQDGVINVPLPGGLQAAMRVPTSPETLRMIAQATGGRFFTAPDATQLRTVYRHLGSRLGSRRESREVTDLFAGGSAALLLIGGGLSALWFRRVP